VLAPNITHKQQNKFGPIAVVILLHKPLVLLYYIEALQHRARPVASLKLHEVIQQAKVRGLLKPLQSLNVASAH
jgi:hypothetical protein